MTKRDVTNLSYQIVGYAIKVHKALGPGLLESVYQKCLKYELIKNGHAVIEELKVPLIYDNLNFEADLRLDLLVDNCIIVELKTVEQFHPTHEAKLLTYMSLLKKPQGLLINFLTDNITKSMKPFVNEYFKALPD